MSKLDPKPVNKNPLLGWKDLNNTLQANFSIKDKDQSPSATIKLSRYKMTYEEIKSTAEKQGYTVELEKNNNGEYVIFS